MHITPPARPMLMEKYRLLLQSGGRTVNCFIKKRKAGKLNIRVDGSGVTVLVPEHYSGAAIERFVYDNSAWIFGQLDNLPGSRVSDDQSGSRSGAFMERSPADYENLVRTLFTRRYYEYGPGTEAPGQFPEIRFRQMTTKIAVYRSDTNTVCFTRAFTGSKKEAIDVMISYAVSLLSGPEGTVEFKESFYDQCPGWRDACPLLSEKHTEVLRKALKMQG